MASRHAGGIVALFLAFSWTALPARTHAGGQKTASAADVKALAAKIDELIEAHWKENKVKPAKPAEDAVFLRRVYLDLTGRIPSAKEARAFLDSSDPDKRAKLIDRLLASEEHAKHLATIWRVLLIPDREYGGSLDTWLQRRVRDNTGYDRLARAVVAFTLQGGPGKDDLA